MQVTSGMAMYRDLRLPPTLPGSDQHALTGLASVAALSRTKAKGGDTRSGDFVFPSHQELSYLRDEIKQRGITMKDLMEAIGLNCYAGINRRLAGESQWREKEWKIANQLVGIPV
jgi:hypothetical protein